MWCINVLPLSPYPLDPIFSKYGISRNDRKFLNQRLSCQESVKGIAVKKRKGLNLGNMPEINRKQLKVVGSQLLRDKTLNRLYKAEFANARLYRHFPAAGNTQKAFVMFTGNSSPC